MPWQVPSAKLLAERMASALEYGISVVKPLVDPVALSRAVRSARGMLSLIIRAVSLEIREIHDHVAWFGRQYFVDTAEDEFVTRHANIWGITPRPTTFAVGNVIIEGISGTALPANLELAGSDGTMFITLSAVTIGVEGTVNVASKAVKAGLTGNLETGIRLRTITPFPEINRITVGSSGFAGGAPEETPVELAAATQAHIRQRPHGGAGFDYTTWLRAKFPVRAVKVYTDWIGRGSVGVVVAMKDGAAGRVPTVTEMTDQLNYLGAPNSSTGVRPVTAYTVIVPVRLRVIPLTIRVRPDTVATRAAVSESWTAFVTTIGDDRDDQNDSPIGAIIERSRISEALSAASGEYAHDLISPAARFVLERDEYPIAGSISFED